MADERWYPAATGVPADLTAAADVLNSVIEFLISVANVALTILEVVKSLLIGLLNPIKAIVEAIIAEIEAFLNDLRQLGVYVTWDDIVYPFDNLVGGFGPYQARMLGRLTNRNDPTRPNFTTRSAVAGIFLFANANPTGIFQVIDLIRLLLRLFGFNYVRSRGFPTPVGLTVSYGGSDFAAFKDLGKILRGGDVPDVAKVRWSIAPPATVIGPVPLLPAPPKFLVEVSVFPDGFGVAYNLPTPNANLNQQTFGVLMDPEGEPLRVYGGSTLGLSPSLGSTLSGTQLTVAGVGSDGELKPNNVTVYAYRNSADTYPIPLSAITGPVNGKHLFQRTFVYDVYSLLGINLLSPGQPFSFRLRAEDMPYNATISQGSGGKVDVVPDDEPAREVYVRVRAVGSGFTADGNGDLETPLYTIDESTFNGTGTVVPATASESKADGFGFVSDPVKVTFPDDQTADYLETVTTAIVLLVLSRSELRTLVNDPGDASFVIGSASSEITAVLQSGSVSLSDLTPTLAAALSTRDVKEVGLCPTGLEAVAAKIVPMFGVMATGGKVTTGGKPDAKSLYGTEGTKPLVFRKKVIDRCRRLAEDILERGGPPTSGMLETVESLSEVFGTVVSEDGTSTTVARTPLRLLRWGQVFPEVAYTTLGGRTILQGLSDPEASYVDELNGVTVVSGVSPNPLSIEDVRPGALRAMYFGSWESTSTITAGSSEIVDSVEPSQPNRVLLRRSPGFILPSGASIGTVPAAIGQGSADMSPVVYAGQSPMWKYAVNSASTVGIDAYRYPPRVMFIRNGVVRFPELATAIANVLNTTTGSVVSGKPTGAWLALRLFPQGIPPIDEFLQKINDFLRAVLDGLQGIVDIIVAYIEFLQARILELEALLRRIQALVSLVLSLDIGAGLYALPVLADSGGTDALVRGLMGAEDPPPSGTDDIGLGFAIVAGGLPSVILEILTLFFPPQDG